MQKFLCLKNIAVNETLQILIQTDWGRLLRCQKSWIRNYKSQAFYNYLKAELDKLKRGNKEFSWQVLEQRAVFLKRISARLLDAVFIQPCWIRNYIQKALFFQFDLISTILHFNAWWYYLMFAFLFAFMYSGWWHNQFELHAFLRILEKLHRRIYA